jgi:hypothetical protein
MLSELELENVFSWKPYRTDWNISLKRSDQNLSDQTILAHFGPLIKEMINNPAFSCTQTQAGDITNYLEFLCYPASADKNIPEERGLLVCVSLCAPLVAFGETLFRKDDKSFAYAFLDPALVGIVHNRNLKVIEQHLHEIISRHKLQVVTSTYASQELPKHLADNLDSLNFGNKILHGIFQWKE